jgi:hypothetical protein
MTAMKPVLNPNATIRALAATRQAAATARAWPVETAPQARGRLDLVGWAASSSRSRQSFRTYTKLAIRQKTTNAPRMSATAVGSSSFFEKSSGTRTKTFLDH